SIFTTTNEAPALTTSTTAQRPINVVAVSEPIQPIGQRRRTACFERALQSKRQPVGGSKGIFMRLVRLRAPGGFDNLKLVEEDHAKPRPGELLVRIRASSLNFHDDMVVLGKIPC